jgi:hypothetical protein
MNKICCCFALFPHRDCLTGVGRLPAGNAPAEPVTVKQTVVVEQTVEKTVVVEVEKKAVGEGYKLATIFPGLSLTPFLPSAASPRQPFRPSSALNSPILKAWRSPMWNVLCASISIRDLTSSSPTADNS